MKQSLALFAAAFLALSLNANSGWAQSGRPLGSPISFAVSAERLFGVAATKTRWQRDPDNWSETNRTRITFLSNHLANTPDNTHDTPRIGFDFFPIQGLSLGIAGGIASTSGNTNTRLAGINAGATLQGTTGVLVSPRIGYAFMPVHFIGVWGRLGMTYFNASSSDANTNYTYDGTSLDPMVDLVLSPLDHVAFTIGLAGAIPVGGSNRTETRTGPVRTTVSVDSSVSYVGLNAGMVVYF